MPLAIYLKNFGMTIAKVTIEHKDQPDRVQYIDRLAQIINLFIKACLSQIVSHKFKTLIIDIITR